MGLFDFLKRRNDPFDQSLKKIWGDQGAAMLTLRMGLTHVEKHVTNLRAVGRESDALKCAGEFLDKVMGEWRNEPSNSWPFELVSDAAISLGAIDMGRSRLELVIQAIEQHPNELPDPTLVYHALGRVYHQMRIEPDKELRCYRKAGEAVAPPNCRYPASRIEKAIVHHFGFMCASRIGQHAQAAFHDAKRRELAPTVDWEDDDHVLPLVISKKEP